MCPLSAISFMALSSQLRKYSTRSTTMPVSPDRHRQTTPVTRASSGVHGLPRRGGDSALKAERREIERFDEGIYASDERFLRHVIFNIGGQQ